MRLSPDVLRAAYEFLRATDPFRRWALPPSEFVKFAVTRSKNIHGDYVVMPNGIHRIRVSEMLHGHTMTLLLTVAHECVHLRQTMRGTCTARVEHNAEFTRLWSTVCRHHGFDPHL